MCSLWLFVVDEYVVLGWLLLLCVLCLFMIDSLEFQIFFVSTICS
jgi:hypothetical protein